MAIENKKIEKGRIIQDVYSTFGTFECPRCCAIMVKSIDKKHLICSECGLSGCIAE